MVTRTRKPKKPERERLSAVGRRERFVAEYLANGGNGTQAWLAASPTASLGSARVQASRMLSDPRVQALLDKAKSKVLKKLEITTERVIGELAKIGFSDIRNAVVWTRRGVRLRPSHAIDDDTAAAISEVSQGPHGVRVKMYDKRAALVDIGKYTGAFKDGPEIGAVVTFTVERTSRSKAPA